LQLAVHKFNEKPKAGVNHLITRGVIPHEPAAVANFLRTTKGLSKRRIGDYLGERSDFTVHVLTAYSHAFDFKGLSFVEAVRAFLSPFRLPGEAQKIDRIMCEFSQRFCGQNPGVFADPDAAYVLGFSVIMLNTDAHSSQIKHKMTKVEFTRNNRGINAGADLPAELLESVYDDIVSHEIKTGTEYDDLGETELMEWLRNGTVFSKFSFSRLAPSRSHSCRLWIRTDGDHSLCYSNLTARTRKEKCVPLVHVEDVLIGPASEVFRRNGVAAQSSDGANCFSLVLAADAGGKRTLDLQANSHDEVSVWTRYFRQVVERGQLEAHARRVAMRAQPRERFLEMASQVWRHEILPAWEDERASKRALMLWWEGVPSALRGQLWRLAIGDRLQLGPAAFAEHVAAATAADADAARRGCEAQLQGSSAELNIFTAETSPMQASLHQLLVAVHAHARRGGPAPTRHAPLLAAMLLLYMEPQDAFVCLSTLLQGHYLGSSHHLGASPAEQWAWRLRCATSVVARELPELHAHLAHLGVELTAFLPGWLGTLFMTTLALDTAARVWDCYLRDGELLVWRCALEILRLLSPQLLQLHEADDCLQLLHGAAEHGGTAAVSERALFASMAEHEEGVAEWIGELSQRQPMPTAETGVAYDLFTNSYLCPREGAADGDEGAERPAEGGRRLAADGDQGGSRTAAGAALPAEGARRKPPPEADGGEGKRAAGRRRTPLTTAPDGKADECVLL